MRRTRVLFLCTHNSARSQMAEGFLRHLAGDRFEVASAGTRARGVHALAVRAMAEVGVALVGHTSKTLERFLAEPWDFAPHGLPAGARPDQAADRGLAGWTPGTGPVKSA